MRFLDMYKAIAVAAMGAMFCGVPDSAMAQIDCLPDGGSCQASVFCPATCCTGVPMRTNGPFRHCPKNVLGPDTPSSTSKSSVTVVPSPSPTMVPSDDNDASPASHHDDPAPSTPAANTTPKPATPPANNNNIPPANPVPSATPKKNDVESFDSRDSNISGSRSSASGGAFPIAIAGVGCCIVLVGAVLYKRRMQPDTSELPNTTTSGYHGPNEGTTPDNRSLDGMLAVGGKRSSVTDSMKQLPVLSIASRQDGSFSRASSPFGHDKARISSPAQSRSSQDDMAFRVEGGSSVHVNFAPQNSELATTDEEGIVAL